MLVEEKDPFGTVLVSVGAVSGGLEDNRKALSWRWIKAVPENPLFEQSEKIRKTIEKNLKEIMDKFPIPRNTPVLLLACSNKRCKYIYITETNFDVHCPQCKSLPR